MKNFEWTQGSVSNPLIATESNSFRSPPRQFPTSEDFLVPIYLRTYAPNCQWPWVICIGRRPPGILARTHADTHSHRKWNTINWRIAGEYVKTLACWSYCYLAMTRPPDEYSSFRPSLGRCEDSGARTCLVHLEANRLKEHSWFVTGIQFCMILTFWNLILLLLLTYQGHRSRIRFSISGCPVLDVPGLHG